MIFAHPVEGCVHHDQRIQDLGLWWNVDNENGAGINDKRPASKSIWEGYMKSPISPMNHLNYYNF